MSRANLGSVSGQGGISGGMGGGGGSANVWNPPAPGSGGGSYRGGQQPYQSGTVPQYMLNSGGGMGGQNPGLGGPVGGPRPGGPPSMGGTPLPGGFSSWRQFYSALQSGMLPWQQEWAANQGTSPQNDFYNINWDNPGHPTLFGGAPAPPAMVQRAMSAGMTPNAGFGGIDPGSYQVSDPQWANYYASFGGSGQGYNPSMPNWQPRPGYVQGYPVAPLYYGTTPNPSY